MDNRNISNENKRLREQAIQLVREGRFEEALAAFEDAIHLNPKNAIPWNGKGNILFQIGHYNEALEAYEEAIRLDSNYAYPWNGKGNYLFILDRYEDSLIAYEKAIQIDPNDAMLWNGKGNALFKLDHYRDALVAYEKATQIDPNNATLWNSMGNTLYKLERNEEALRAYEKAIQIQQNDAMPWNGKGNILCEHRRYKDSLDAYENIIQLDTDEAAPWKGKGNALYKLDRYDEALLSYEKAIQINPNNTALWKSKGNALCELGRYEDALGAYEEEIRLDPNNLLSWNSMGNALLELGRYKEALASFEEAIRLDSNHNYPWNGKGNILYELGHYEDSLEAYEKAIQLAPNEATPWNGRGNALCELGHYKDSLVAYEKAIQLEPNNAMPWNGKGNALCELGRYKDSLVAYEKAIQLEPNDATPRNGKGHTLYELGRYKEALADFEEAIRLESTRAAVWINKAVLLSSHPDLIEDRIDRNPHRCLCRAVFLAWPSCSARDSKYLRSAILMMAENDWMCLLLERLLRRILPEGGLLTMESVLRQTKEDTEIAYSVFAWLENPSCPLRPIERIRLRGQVLLRFGDPIMSWQVLDELDSTMEGERDLAGQLYLIWSLREYLESYDKDLDFAYTQAKNWMRDKLDSPDEMTYYYAGHIALLKDDLNMAKEAFHRADPHPANLLMSWQVARLMKDDEAADRYLSLLLTEEHKYLKEGRTGILFPEALSPFDPNTTDGQEELQLVLRRFEVSGALMDLLETVNLRKHQGYQILASEFEELTKTFVDIERYEHAIRTWKLKEEVRQKLEIDQVNANRQAAENEMHKQANNFAMLGVQLPCSLREKDLEERLAQGLFNCDLSIHRDAAINTILLILRLEWLKAEYAVLLIMYTHVKGHHDLHKTRAKRLEKFTARTAVEAMILYLLRCCDIGFVVSTVTAIGGWSLSQKLIDAVQAIYGDFHVGDGEVSLTYVEFLKHLHRYWDESGNAEDFRTFFQ